VTTAAETSLDEIATEYVALVLGIGVHDPHYVDAYYGPADAQDAAERANLTLQAIDARAQALLATLARLPPTGDDLDILRHRFLERQLSSMRVRIALLSGESMTFDEESRALYDAVAPRHSEAHFAQVLERLDARLSGDGSLSERYEAFSRRFEIPKNKLAAVFRAAIDEARKRTRGRIELPEGESFEIEYVTGKAWSAYNWYKGGYHSLIQVNTDFPVAISRAIDLACHEGYPGHHVYNVLIEKHLVQDRGFVEMSVYALFSPQSLIAEGTANLGIEVAFPGNERLQFEREVLFPLAGLDPAQADDYYAVQALMGELSYAGNEAARGYLDGEMTAEETVAWLSTYTLTPPDRGKQRVRFYDTYRSYVVNYNLGQDKVRTYIERRGGTADAPDQRWLEFRKLLASPRLPGGLAD
jgi:hypothetical protein